MTFSQQTILSATAHIRCIHDFQAIQALFESNGFTEEKGFEYTRFMNMSGWGYEIGQEGFGIRYRDEDDINRIRGFVEKLPFMTYIGELSDEDDDGEYYDCIYYVDNTTFKSYRRQEKIRVALEA